MKKIVLHTLVGLFVLQGLCPSLKADVLPDGGVGSAQQIAMLTAVLYSFAYTLWKSYSKLVKTNDPQKEDPVGFVKEVVQLSADEMGLVTQEQMNQTVEAVIRSELEEYNHQLSKHIDKKLQDLTKRLTDLTLKLDRAVLRQLLLELIQEQTLQA